MPRAHNGNVEIEFDHFGDPAHDAVLLVMGYTAQMTAWDQAFCEMLAMRNHFVIRFDNRDCGLSSKTTGDVPNVMAILMNALAGGAITEAVPYSLADMATDATRVLDELGVSDAHVVGASMGGMIAQQMAIDHPDRVRALTSIMSTTGARGVGQPTPTAQTALFTPPPQGDDERVGWGVEVARAISGPLFDEDEARRRVAAAIERSFYPAGGAFQMAAIAKTGDRTEQLAELNVPALIIHGKVDPLIQLSGGEATAAAITGAQLLTFDEMGHDLPRPLWGQITDAITGVTRSI